MKERPIICRDDEVRAFLDGRKTQLRRPMKPIASDAFPTTPLFKIDGGLHVPLDDNARHSVQMLKHCPFGVVGDRLWVRECFTTVPSNSGADKHVLTNDHDEQGVRYRATWDKSNFRAWRPSSQMPRWASRITLEITNVRVERLQDITKQDAISEGAKRVALGQGFLSDARCAFRDAWDHAYGESIDPRTGKSNAEKNPFAWINNPFVWVIGVEVRT